MKPHFQIRAAFLLILASLLLSFFSSSAPAQDQQPTIRFVRNPDPAPEFKLTGLDGKPVTLAGAHGKVILLNFWATWCGPCRAEIPDLIELQARYKDTLQIVGIAQDSGSAADVKRFAVEHKMNYPSLLSTPEIEKLFPPESALPPSFFLDRDGRLAQKHRATLRVVMPQRAALESPPAIVFGGHVRR